MRLRNNYKKLLAAAILATMLLISSCSLMPKEDRVLAPPLAEPEKIEYETIKAEKSYLEKTASCTAYFVSSKRRTLYFDISGYIENIYVEIDAGVRTSHDFTENGEEPNDGLRDVRVEEGQLLAELDTGDLDYDINIQELLCQKYENEYQKLKSESEIYLIKQAEIDLEIARLQLEKLKYMDNRAQLISPVSGLIDYVSDYQIGDYINAYTPFIKIIDPSQLVLESDDDSASKFEMGMEVKITFDNKQYQGIVIGIPSLPTKEDYQRAVQSGNLAQYTRLMDSITSTVRFSITGMDSPPNLGDWAEIDAVLIKKDDIIVMPKSVIGEFDGRYYVRILQDGVPTKRFVQLGLESESYYEIVSGLEVGEQVIK